MFKLFEQKKKEIWNKDTLQIRKLHKNDNKKNLNLLKNPKDCNNSKKKNSLIRFESKSNIK